MADFFKAGARIARTGGTDAESVMRKWCEENRLTSRQESDTMAGFLAEMKNNPDHKTGLPLGGKK